LKQDLLETLTIGLTVEERNGAAPCGYIRFDH
jgi:hypothetical protein